MIHAQITGGLFLKEDGIQMSLSGFVKVVIISGPDLAQTLIVLTLSQLIAQIKSLMRRFKQESKKYVYEVVLLLH